MNTRITLSDRSIAALPFAASQQRIIRDSELAGFFLLVGADSDEAGHLFQYDAGHLFQYEAGH